MAAEDSSAGRRGDERQPQAQPREVVGVCGVRGGHA